MFSSLCFSWQKLRLKQPRTRVPMPAPLWKGWRSSPCRPPSPTTTAAFPMLKVEVQAPVPRLLTGPAPTYSQQAGQLDGYLEVHRQQPLHGHAVKRGLRRWPGDL